ncbi:MAG: hypothetical protein MI892_17020, partial [Desulfobacterales bacterium]|nr:hypothetical protein [Desulfobacterales bacterium]
LRAEGDNVYVIDPGLDAKKTHDIFYGGDRKVANGIKGEIKTLTGKGKPKTINNAVKKAVYQLEKNNNGGKGTIFIENVSKQSHEKVVETLNRIEIPQDIEIIVTSP